MSIEQKQDHDKKPRQHKSKTKIGGPLKPRERLQIAQRKDAAKKKLSLLIDY